MTDEQTADTREDLYREALELIARDGCERYVKTCDWTCRSSGRTRGARYTDEAWCLPCIAADALERAHEEAA